MGQERRQLKYSPIDGNRNAILQHLDFLCPSCLISSRRICCVFETIHGNGQLPIVLKLGLLPLPLYLFHPGFHLLSFLRVVHSHPLRGNLDLLHLCLQFPLCLLQFLSRLPVLRLQRLGHLLSKLLHLSLMSLELLFELIVDAFSGCSVGDILAFVHQFPLDLQHGRLVLHDPPNDIVSGFGDVVMSNHLRALIERRFEKFTGKFSLASFVDVVRVLIPHVGDYDDVLQCRFTAEFAEQAEIPSGDPAKPIVGDTVEVDDSSEHGAFLIPVERFSEQDRKTMTADARLRVGQEERDQLQDLSIALCSVIKSWGVDERHGSPVESELVGELDLCRTRL